MQGGGNKLSYRIHLVIGYFHHPAYITDGAPGGHGAEGDDLCHMVITILAADIVHHFLAAGVSEVHVNIGHGHTLGVQETLEIEVIFHGVNVRDVQAVGHHASGGGAAAGTYGDAHTLSIADKVGDDKKIVRKAHFLDHIQLVNKLLAVALLLRSVPLGKALVAELAQVGGRIEARGQLELRQVILAEGEVQLAAIGNALGVFHGLGIGGKQSLHLLSGANIEIPGLIAHTVFIVHGLTGLDA